MALCWVVRSDGSGVGTPVYVDGNYIDIAGAIGTPFRTETGMNTFETIDTGLIVTWQKTSVIITAPDNAGSNPVLVTLNPVPRVPTA
jgi:hypothetical protein